MEVQLQENNEVELAGLTEQYVGSDEEIFTLLAECSQQHQKGLPPKRKFFNFFQTDSNLFTEVVVTKKSNSTGTTLTSRLCVIDTEEKDYKFFEPILHAVAEGDTEFDFFANALNAIMYSRTCINTNTTVLLCCAPSSENGPETMTTLSLIDQYVFKIFMNLIFSLEKITVHANQNSAGGNAAPATAPATTPAPVPTPAPTPAPEPSKPKEVEAPTPTPVAVQQQPSVSNEQVDAYKAEIVKLEKEVDRLGKKNKTYEDENENLFKQIQDWEGKSKQGSEESKKLTALLNDANVRVLLWINFFRNPLNKPNSKPTSLRSKFHRPCVPWKSK